MALTLIYFPQYLCGQGQYACTPNQRKFVLYNKLFF